MRLIVDQSLTTGFILINTLQQRASLPFKPGVLEGKIHVYNNDNKTFFYVLTFAKPSCENVFQPSPLRGSCCNTHHTPAWQTLIYIKECFSPLILSDSGLNCENLSVAEYGLDDSKEGSHCACLHDKIYS